MGFLGCFPRRTLYPVLGRSPHGPDPEEPREDEILTNVMIYWLIGSSIRM
jgi:hypothetical protein